jgi:hypothetical protein
VAGVLLLAATVVCLAACGWVAADLLGLRSAVLRWLAAYVLAWTTLVVAAVVASVPGWLSSWSLAACIVVLTGLAVLFRTMRPGARGTVIPRPAWRAALADPVVRSLALTVALAGLYVGAVAFLTTPNDWDGLTYHETRAILWDQQGSVSYVPAGNDPRLNGNPPLSELGLYLAMILPRSERFAALPQYIALWASLLAVALVARRLGLSRPAAAYGALVFATLPVVLLHGAAVLNDLVVASFLLASTVFLCGRSRAELAVGSVALGLALSTKFDAVLALPLVVAVALVLAPSGKRGACALACAVGAALGTPWYVLNRIETGTFDGDLGDTTGQAADHTFRGVVGTLRALLFDVVDTSGFWRSEKYVAVVVGAVLIVAAGALAWRRRREARALALAGLLAAAVPMVLRASEGPARHAWRSVWFKLGREDIALDHGGAWDVVGLPDTSVSWFGAAGAVVILGGVAAGLVGVRRAGLRRSALLLALAPLALILDYALTIVYDPWRGRLLMFGVGLACAAWGWTIRVRWLSVGVAALCITTVALSLVHWYTKPSGLRLLEPSGTVSIWRRDRIDTLTVIRNYDGTPGILREVEREVPSAATLAVAAPLDTFLAPLAGGRLTRTLRLVADGARVPADAKWLATRSPSVASRCREAWSTVYVDEDRWRLLRRIAPETCSRARTLR